MALEAVKGQLTLAELAKKFEVNQVLISRWKPSFWKTWPFLLKKVEQKKEPDVDTQQLYAQIEQLKVENEFLKEVARRWVCKTAPGFAITPD